MTLAVGWKSLVTSDKMVEAVKEWSSSVLNLQLREINVYIVEYT